MHFRFFFRAVLPALLATQLVAAAPGASFDKLYGEQAKKVQIAHDPKETDDFVQGLIRDAGELKDDPTFQAVVYTKAYEIAIQASLFATAEESMEKFAAAQPDRRGEANEKLLAALGRDSRPASRTKLETMKGRRGGRGRPPSRKFPGSVRTLHESHNAINQFATADLSRLLSPSLRMP